MNERRYDEQELDRCLTSDDWERLRDLVPMGLMGAATLGVGIARLRWWTRTRLQRMDVIADGARTQAP